MKKFLSLHGSWLTRLLGIAIILQSVGAAGIALLDGNPATNINWTAFWLALSTGWGIAIARQNNVTSSELGLQPTPVNTDILKTVTNTKPLTIEEKENLKKIIDRS